MRDRTDRGPTVTAAGRLATLADVAILAGVSKATASRVLSRPELVSPDTAARVLAAARKLGFVPNRAARQLARGRSGVVAVVVPTLDNAFFTPIIAGAQAAAGRADLQLTVAVHPLAEVGELVAFERLSHQVDGFIVVAPRGADDVVRLAIGHKPTVLVDREVTGASSVVADTATAFGALVSRFVEQGHERIAYLGGPDGSWQNRQRTAAVVAAAGGLAELTVLGPYPSTFEAGVRASADVLASGATAVVPYATAIGLGLMYVLRGDEHRGRSLTVSSERMVVDALGLVGVPAIDVDGEHLGRVAAERLIEAIASGGDAERSSLRLDVPVRWPVEP
ncbi:LacI family DNA-binding transcriptional regulator [Frigoribacterium faeni]|uniref:LacI family transcriptional regulator/LacI family repressor for deo operon, udp, cdd, tsx, nupC, and nupG n=1 Tax=Frigoribacterium faeni TaxID=145483 RepID=A0A7W3JI08_9MICO|nr:LacI family DNA-binding transcriptional regulator [Frigoribacterium faeni]MBA8813245.1 LacI family transcriptional regulator/LacI family repressor for deo operon, udp, cdd, tsx, nupC, and nupG [Frigoribacterium faeni]